MFQGWLREILSPQQIDSFYRDKELDSAFAFPFVRVRINLLDSLRGPAMVLRLIPQTILSLEQLNLPEVIKDLAARPPQRTRSNYRADWIWEKHNLGRDDRLDQPQ